MLATAAPVNDAGFDAVAVDPPVVAPVPTAAVVAPVPTAAVVAPVPTA